MEYYCVTHKPMHWNPPAFVNVVSAGGVDDEPVTDISHVSPGLASRGRELGEYSALFSVRRLSEDSHEGGRMIGFAHYRRFSVTQPVGVPDDVYTVASPAVFSRVAPEVLLPPSDTILMPLPIDLGRSVLEHYSHFCQAEDLLRFFAIAVEEGVVEGPAASAFLTGNVMVPAASVGVYPRGWAIAVLEALELVANSFAASGAPPRQGYQARAASFCAERLQGLLLMQLLSKWPRERVIANRSVIVADGGRYVGGA